MQNDEHDAYQTIRAPGSQREETSNKPQLSAKVVRRLEKLAPLRIDPAVIEFPEGASVFEGGYAVVSRALLGSRSHGTSSRVVESQEEKVNASGRITNLEGGNRRRKAEESNGETSGQRKVVAVKKMKMKTPDELLRVLSLTLREAEVLAGLSHENIIKLEGFAEDVSKEVIWLVFPWEDNGNLKDFAAKYDWEVPERIALIYDVARGVEYLHTRTPPICHADLKSVNILVNSKCRAVITDFGSAHPPEANGDNKETKEAIDQPQPVPSVEAIFCTSTNTITLTGIQCTTRWAAPEVLESDEFSLASDIWALGWVAYEVMTNYIPFHDIKEAMVVRRVVRGDLPSISNDVRMLLMQALCTLVGQCLEIDPTKRPTAKECRETIGWMPMIAPTRGRTKDRATIFVDHSGELLMNLGDMHVRQGDYSNALRYFTQALHIYTDTGKRGEEANALLELAQIQSVQERDSEAITSYTKALEIYRHLGNKRGRASALCGLAEVHRRRNEYKKAVTFYSKGLQMWTDIGDGRGRASALWGLAEVHRLQNEYVQAVTFYSESLQIRTDIGDRAGRASALWGLAEVHRLRNEYTQAVTFYSESLRIRTDIGDRRGRAEALGGLADIHRLRKEYTQAVAFYSESLQIRTDIGDRGGRASALWGLAEVHRLRNEYPQAVTFFSECLQIRTNIGDRAGRASALWGLAQVHRLQNEYTQAVTFFSECLQIRTDIGDRAGRAEALWGLAEVHRLRNEYTQAVTFYSECLQIRTDIGDRAGRAYALWGLAEVHRLRNEYSQAITFFTEVLNTFTDLGSKSWSAFTLWSMACTERDQGHRTSAIQHYEDAAELSKQVGDSANESVALTQAAALRRSLEQQRAI